MRRSALASCQQAMAPRRALRSRHLATATPGALVFDRALKDKQRDRAAAAPDSAKFDYLRAEVAERLVDRLADIKGRRFERILDVGAHHGPLLPLLRDGGFGLEARRPVWLCASDTHDDDMLPGFKLAAGRGRTVERPPPRVTREESILL